MHTDTTKATTTKTIIDYTASVTKTSRERAEQFILDHIGETFTMAPGLGIDGIAVHETIFTDSSINPPGIKYRRYRHGMFGTYKIVALENGRAVLSKFHRVTCRDERWECDPVLLEAAEPWLEFEGEGEGEK